MRDAPRCAVMGCTRPADTEVDGMDRRTGAALPVRYVCDDPKHQYYVALSLLPADERLPSEAFGETVQSALAAWNERERSRDA